VLHTPKMFPTRGGRLALLAAIAAICVPALAFAGHETSNVASYTGCLTDTGQIVSVAVGDAPKVACDRTQTPLHVSGGDITAVSTPSGSGLFGGTENGAASLSLGTTYKLPQGCSPGQVPKFRKSLNPFPDFWECGNDNVIDRRAPAAASRFPVAPLGPVGGAIGSTTIGADGFGLIAYLDFANFDLRVAHCENATCGTSTSTPIDSFGPIGGQVAIAIGKDGFGLISYYDAGPSDLKVAHCQDVACTSATKMTIDSAGSVGGLNSLTIGSDGFGLVSYNDGTNRNLKVAHCLNVACSSASATAIDTPGDVGGWSSIAIGADGLGLISYADVANDDLKVAHCLNVACTSATKTTIDSVGIVAGSTSVVIGSDGLGLISYSDSTPNYDLKVAHCVNVSCSSATKTPVDTAGMVGLYSSITIGADGLGLIAYQDDYPHYDLKVAHCQSVACSSATNTTVVGPDHTDGGGSLTVGPDGLGLMSYEDSDTETLKVAHCSNLFCANYFRRR
jgi:hypothetical protein